MKPQRPTTLRIHIERLSVEGMTAANGRFIGQVINSELTKLVNRASWSAPAEDLRIGGVPGPALPYGATPDAIGRQVAQRIFQSLGGRTRA